MRPTVNARLLAGIATIAGAMSATAQQTTPIDPSQIDSIIRQQIAEKHIIGVSVGIMQNGRVAFSRGYGVANVKSSTPVTPNTMSAIGSVTKQFTCSSLLMLQEQHKLSINDPVAKYYPRLTRAKD